MSIVSVAEKWDGRGATTDEQGVRTFTRQWTVETDSDPVGEPDVLAGVVTHDASAALYAAHPAWAWALCRRLTAAPHGGPRVWLVDAAYSTAPFAAKDGGSPTFDPSNPSVSDSPSAANSNSTPADQRSPTISIARKEITEPLEFDVVTHNRVLNTAGDPLDPPIEVFRSHQVITWKFFRRPNQLNWDTRSHFLDTLNAADYTVLGATYAAGTLRCTEYSFETVWETATAGIGLFFAFTVQAEYAPDGWQPKVLNTGRRQMVGSLGNPDNPIRAVLITDDDGQPVADPVPLDAFGKKVEPGGAYHYLEPAAYLDTDWSGLLA